MADDFDQAAQELRRFIRGELLCVHLIAHGGASTMIGGESFDPVSYGECLDVLDAYVECLERHEYEVRVSWHKEDIEFRVRFRAEGGKPFRRYLLLDHRLALRGVFRRRAIRRFLRKCIPWRRSSA